MELSFENREVRAAAREDSEDSAAKSRRLESIELRPVYEIDNSALLCTRASGNY